MSEALQNLAELYRAPALSGAQAEGKINRFLGIKSKLLPCYIVANTFVFVDVYQIKEKGCETLAKLTNMGTDGFSCELEAQELEKDEGAQGSSEVRFTIISKSAEILAQSYFSKMNLSL